MPDFIQAYLDYTKHLESPESFFQWAAYSCVGALLRDNVHLPYGTQEIHTNLYVLLLADPAGHRKSVPLGITGKIIETVRNTKIIRGRTTIAGILQDLAQPSVNERGEQITGGSCILLAEELASFFVQDPETIPRLTDLYDYHKSWDDNLRSGKLTIKNLCLSMLAASNEEYLKSVYTRAAVYGGLLRRTFFVRPRGAKEANPLFGRTNGNYDLNPLINIAKEISKMRGVFTGDPEAIQRYEEWYRKLFASYGKNGDRSGIVESIHVHVLKIAMILAAGRRQELVIRWSDLEEAIQVCIDLIPNYGAFNMATGSADHAAIGAIFLTEIWERANHEITRREFLRDNWGEVDAEAFDKFISTIEQAGLIYTDLRSEVWYKLTPEGEEKLKVKLATS